MYLNYYNYILFMPMFIISMLFSLIVNSWFSMWMIMELSLISMIMLMLFDKMIKFELLMKYYLFQSFNSYLFLINILGLFIMNMKYFSLIMMNLTMLMKLSIIPFHFWYIKIMKNLNWMNIYLFSILNKIIPLFIINNIMNYYMKLNYFINLILLLISSFISSICGIIEINLKLIFSYSSMIQISWIITLMMFNEMMSISYFLIYNFISINIYLILYMLNLNYLIQLNNMKMFNNLMYLILMFLMFSLAGIPPFFGFLMKWISIKIFVFLNMNFFFIIMFIMNSLISIFFYFRMMFSMLMNYYILNKMNIKFINYFNNLNYKMMMFNWINMMLLTMYEII